MPEQIGGQRPSRADQTPRRLNCETCLRAERPSRNTPCQCRECTGWALPHTSGLNAGAIPPDCVTGNFSNPQRIAGAGRPALLPSRLSRLCRGSEPGVSIPAGFRVVSSCGLSSTLLYASQATAHPVFTQGRPPPPPAAASVLPHTRGAPCTNFLDPRHEQFALSAANAFGSGCVAAPA